MQYQKENEYNRVYEEASAAYAIRVELLKAISAVESEFQTECVSGYPPRYGLMGLTLPLANAVSNQQEISRSDLFDARCNIILGAKFLRLLYHRLDNPDTFDVIREYGKQMRELPKPDQNYANKVWEKYKYFASKMQPDSTLPKDVEGVRML
jgi:hypothetical protein